MAIRSPPPPSAESNPTLSCPVAAGGEIRLHRRIAPTPSTDLSRRIERR